MQRNVNNMFELNFQPVLIRLTRQIVYTVKIYKNVRKGKKQQHIITEIYGLMICRQQYFI